jgi:hypothetical protein
MTTLKETFCLIILTTQNNLKMDMWKKKEVSLCQISKPMVKSKLFSGNT